MEILLGRIKEDYVVDWISYIETSIKHNWKLSNTLKNVSFSVQEVYGIEYSEEVMFRLNYYLNKKGIL